MTDYSKFVEKYYEMDPKTVDLLANGSKLKNGMVVLIEDFMTREDPENQKHDSEDYRKYTYQRLLENNRWAKVSDLRVKNGLVEFVATYIDGTKKHRRFAESYAWFVLLDSSDFAVKLYPDFVDRDYVMDPKTEDLLSSGTKLQNGMRVLVQGVLGLEDTRRPLEGYQLKNARENNRWCTVTELEIQERWDDGYDYDYSDGFYSLHTPRRRERRKLDPLVTFVGVYDDGTKAKRSFSAHFSWLVKKDSIPGRNVFDAYAEAVHGVRSRSQNTGETTQQRWVRGQLTTLRPKGSVLSEQEKHYDCRACDTVGYTFR